MGGQGRNGVGPGTDPEGRVCPLPAHTTTGRTRRHQPIEGEDRPGEKASLRALMRTQRRRITPDEARLAGETLVERVLGTVWWCEARSVLGYVAVRGEVDPGPLLREALRAGKAVSLPRPDPATLDLRPCPWNGVDRLVPGPYGIPVPLAHALYGGGRPDVVLVPGLAFDAKGNRLGTGAGYYDRYLAGPAPGWAVGLAHDWQVVPSVPVEPHDRPLDAVVTPARLIWVKGETR